MLLYIHVRGRDAAPAARSARALGRRAREDPDLSCSCFTPSPPIKSFPIKSP